MVPVVLQGSVVDPADARRALDEGVADVVEMTRAQIADPDLVVKIRRGAVPRPCVLCNQTCQVLDPRNPVVTCVGNPTAGHETVDPVEGIADVATGAVLVVGGGPAGLEAARVLALRGHRVTVADASARVGGMVRAAVGAPHLTSAGRLARERMPQPRGRIPSRHHCLGRRHRRRGTRGRDGGPRNRQQAPPAAVPGRGERPVCRRRGPAGRRRAGGRAPRRLRPGRRTGRRGGRRMARGAGTRREHRDPGLRGRFATRHDRGSRRCQLPVATSRGDAPPRQSHCARSATTACGSATGTPPKSRWCRAPC